ncbi:MAG: ferredoxin thioredoxin reductase, catalytic chain [Monoraphidium minutum]|nr:MAG: ferredoxin thioredoxin reductase, catalytic chain [Monoraphidium minutum]
MSLATLRTGRAAGSIAQRQASSLPVSSCARRSVVARSNHGVENPDAKTIDKNLELMRHFSEQYAMRSGTYFCEDKGVTAVVIQGLAEHKATLGAPLCPCRHYDDKAAEAANGFWNCPCVPMRERKECHCMLFLTEDNDFAGREQHITHDEIEAGLKAMM